MNQVANTVAPVAPEAIIPVADLNTAQLPGLVITPEQAKLDAELEAAEAKAAEEAAKVKRDSLTRFEAQVGFKLEGQVIGQAFSRKVSKTGAVSMSLQGKKELSKLSGGLKGFDLEHWSRMQKDVMKGQQSQLMARLASDNNWTGGNVKLSAKGDKITIEVVKAAPMTVSMAAEPTDEQVAQLLGLTVEQVKAMKSAKMAAMKAADEAYLKAQADEKAAQELAAEEAALVKASAEGNGEVHTAEQE